jgi:hypothetical protein
MPNQNNNPNFNSNIQDEISLKDINGFLVESWMAILELNRLFLKRKMEEYDSLKAEIEGVEGGS